MHKEDWYFAASLTLGLLAILGTDWKVVFGRVTKRPSKTKYLVVLTAMVATMAISMVNLQRVNALEVYRTLDERKLTLVSAKEFQNEKVELDGKNFEHCKFNHVTLVLKGRSNFALRNNEFAGGVWIDAANGPASQIVSLMKAMGMTDKNVSVDEQL